MFKLIISIIAIFGGSFLAYDQYSGGVLEPAIILLLALVLAVAPHFVAIRDWLKPSDAPAKRKDVDDRADEILRKLDGMGNLNVPTREEVEHALDGYLKAVRDKAISAYDRGVEALGREDYKAAASAFEAAL